MTAGEDGGMASVFAAIQKQDWSTARTSCERLLSWKPDTPEALHALSVICWSEGQPEAALRHLQNALTSRSHPTWYNNLGVLYSQLHRWDDAAGAFRRALELEPEDEDALFHLGLALCETGELAASIDIFSKIVAKRPAKAEAWTGLGRVRFDQGDALEAYRSLLRAVELDPGSAEARQHLVRTCILLRRFPEALDHARKFSELHPSADAFVYLAVAFSEAGLIEDALAARDQAFSFGIADPKLHSALLRLAQFDPSESGMSMVSAHRQWALTHCPIRPKERSFRNSRDGRKLRIGFVAAELLTTPARHFRLPLLRNLNQELFDIYVYNLSPPYTLGPEVPGVHREIFHRSDPEAIDLMLKDEIDILVDCSGHQSYGRPRIFALCPAPVQVAYSGYPGTTGLTSMDCLFTDSVLSPRGSEDEYSEPLCRLDGGRFLYAPPADAPAVTALPAASNHQITFGVFQTGAKLNAQFRRLVVSVLNAVPRSRVRIHHGDLSYDDAASSTVRRIRDSFVELGVASDRIDFIGRRNLVEHLSVIAGVDIALDTLPFNGHATTCECLWMGVPVLTRLGASHVGRVSAGLLTQAGCREWIASSDSEYLALAKGLAEDTEKLALRRAQLRARMSLSSLMDVRARTLEFESACLALWRSAKVL